MFHDLKTGFFHQEERAQKAELLAKRWEGFPESLRTNRQLAGKTAVSCSATHHVMERCNFSCTCCYLGKEANKTEPLPFADVKDQLDEIRAALGVGGKVQITAGEVTLLPLEKLGRIVSYALSIGLDPMVMSHGQRFLDEPEYLKSLVSEYGLEKISIHIDTTQRGRRGTHSKMSETDLHAVRDDFARLIRRVRHETGKPLVAASTVTVTESNLSEVSEITRWFFANSDAFRLLSFLPMAGVGRTRSSQEGIEKEGLWERIDEVCGQRIERQPLQFGHADCNNLVPLILCVWEGDWIIFEGVREGNRRDQQMLSRAIDTIGSQLNWARPWWENVAPLMTVCLRRPKFLIQTLNYSLYRLWSERSKLKQVIYQILRKKEWPRLQPFLFIIHNFMSPAELKTPLGQERLQACTFKVPVDGELVSMCEMNAAGIREKLDRLNISAQQGSPEHLATNHKISA